jgi:hypothetical protein
MKIKTHALNICESRSFFDFFFCQIDNRNNGWGSYIEVGTALGKTGQPGLESCQKRSIERLRPRDSTNSQIMD